MPLFLTRDERTDPAAARAEFDPQVYPGKTELRGNRIRVNPGVTDGEDLRTACALAMEAALCQGFEEIVFSARNNVVTPEALRDAVKAAAEPFMGNGWLTVILRCEEPVRTPGEREDAPSGPVSALQRLRRFFRLLSGPPAEEKPRPAAEDDLDAFLAERRSKSAAAMVRERIAEKGWTDAECCARANVDRRTLSALREEAAFRPGKPLLLAFALALELSEEETGELLAKGGYALSDSVRFDAIAGYCLRNGPRDVYAVNELLFRYGEPLLGSCELT